MITDYVKFPFAISEYNFCKLIKYYFLAINSKTLLLQINYFSVQINWLHHMSDLLLNITNLTTCIKGTLLIISIILQ